MTFGLYRKSQQHSLRDKQAPCDDPRVRRDDADPKHWVIDLDSLEELQAFIKKYGKISMGNDWLEIEDAEDTPGCSCGCCG